MAWHKIMLTTRLVRLHLYRGQDALGRGLSCHGHAFHHEHDVRDQIAGAQRKRLR